MSFRTLTNSRPVVFARSNRRWLQLFLGTIIAVAVLYWLFSTIDWQATRLALSKAHLVWVVIALASVFVNSVAKAERWRMLFPADRPTPSHREAFNVLMAGQLTNFILPLRSGDILRAYLVGRDRGASTATAFGTIGAEKVIDLIVIGFLAALVLPWIVLPSWINADGTQVIVLSVLAGLVWLGLCLLLPRIERLLSSLSHHSRLLDKAMAVIRRLLDGFTAVRDLRKLPGLISWTVLVWATAFTTNLLLFQAFDIDAGLLGAVLVLVFVVGGVSIPVTLGNLGIFEGLAVLALSLAGIEPATALAFALLLHLLVLIVPAFFGGTWFLRRLRRPHDLSAT